MKKLLLLLLMLIALLINTGAAHAETVHTFPELLRPHQIAVDDTQIYIGDGASVYIYSLKDFTLVKKFGREGEGPQEFRNTDNSRTRIDVRGKYLLVNSTKRVSYFKKDGTYIKEINPAFGRLFQAMGDNYIAAHRVRRADKQPGLMRAIKIFDPDLKEIKQVGLIEGRYIRHKGYRIFAETLTFQAHNGKIFIGGHHDFFIDVFDKNGNKLKPITLDYQRPAVTEQDKQDVINYIKTSPNYVNTRDFFLSVLLFPKTFPAIWNFTTADNKVYVLTYKRKKGKTEMFVFDTEGKLLEKTFIPLVVDNFYRPGNPFTIANGKLYQLLENDDEEWQLLTHLTQ